MNRTDEAFALHKAAHVAEAIARNLQMLRWGRDVREVIRNHSNFTVIGAGHTLGEHIPATGYTIAINSSLVPLARRGFVPCAFVCRESIDMSSQIREANALWPKEATPVAILDVGASHQTWLTCWELRLPIAWFVPAQTQSFWLAAHLGVEPLYAGTSSVTAAVAVAEALGAITIGLVGCSRAFSAEGRAYAAGSNWDTVRLDKVTSEDGPDGEPRVYLGHISGTEAKDALHDASGQRRPLRVERVVPVEAVDGSRRWALETLEGDREWLEVFAARHMRLGLYQHDPDVAIAGCGHKPARVLEERQPDAAAETLAQCERVEAIAAASMVGDPFVDVPGLLGGSPLVDFAGVGHRTAIMQRMQGQGPRKAVPIIKAWREAAGAVREWVR